MYISSKINNNYSHGQDLYCANLFISFFAIPFTYFYGEERQDFLDMDYEIDKNCTKIVNSLKYTVYY